MQNRTLKQITKSLKELSEKGWIKSNRNHGFVVAKIRDWCIMGLLLVKL